MTKKLIPQLSSPKAIQATPLQDQLVEAAAVITACVEHKDRHGQRERRHHQGQNSEAVVIGRQPSDSFLQALGGAAQVEVFKCILG